MQDAYKILKVTREAEKYPSLSTSLFQFQIVPKEQRSNGRCEAFLSF